MSWIQTVLSVVLIAIAWAMAWGHLALRGSGAGDDAMGRGLAVAFLGGLGVLLGIAAVVVGLITQPGVAGKVAPFTPFVLLLVIWGHSTWWYSQLDKRQCEEAAKGPRPWLVIDRDPARRSACAADVRRLDPRHEVTAFDRVDAIADLDPTVLKSLKGVVLDAGEVLAADGDSGKSAALKRLDPITPKLLLAPDDPTADAATTTLHRLGLYGVHVIKATDAASLPGGQWGMTIETYKP